MIRELSKCATYLLLIIIVIIITYYSMICKVNVIENISTHSQTLSFGLCLAYLKSSNHQRRLLVMVRTNYIWHKTDFLPQIFTKLCQICTGTESDQVWRNLSLRDVWSFFIKGSDHFWCLTGGPNWPPWGSEDFWSPNGGPNWPFWESDHISCLTRGPTDLFEKVIIFRVWRGPQLNWPLLLDV